MEGAAMLDVSVLNESVFRLRAGGDIITGTLDTLNADMRHRMSGKHVTAAAISYEAQKDVMSAYLVEKNLGAVVFGKV
jgi:hypothetical protein